MSTDHTGYGTAAGASRLSLCARWSPIPVVLLAMLALWAVNSQTSYESPGLLITLNFIFLGAASFFVAYLIGRTFLVRPRAGLLLMGCGVVAWGAAGVVGVTVGIAASHAGLAFANAALTVHNSTVVLSSACQLAGTLLLLRGRRTMPTPGLWLSGGYALALAAAGMVAVALVAGWLPPFYVPGHGSTPLRQWALASAAAMLAATAGLLYASDRREPSPFAAWYAPALALGAAGPVCVMNAAPGIPVGWLGRAAQYLGGAYMIVAAVASVRESKGWGLVLEEKLRESEGRYRELFDTLLEGFCVIEVLFDANERPVDYRFLETNAAFEAQTGLRDVRGKTIRELIPDNEPYWFDIYGKVARTGEPARLVNEVRALGRWYDVKAYRIGEPSQRRVAILFNDITDRKRAEGALAAAKVSAELAKAAAEDANRAKDQFLAVLSHELRTPLTPVLLTVSLMEQRKDLPADLAADMHTIRRSIELEARIIDDLLDLTRIARGKMAFDMRDIDVHLLVRSAAEICSHGDGAPIELELTAQHRMVHGDAGRLQQVMWNLLTNARKFTPAGGRVTVRSMDAAEGRIRIVVEDTGCGIAPELLPKIFDAFEQGPQSRRHGGLGLGLAISKAIVDAHDGTIRACSGGVGAGSTFMVELSAMAPAVEDRPSTLNEDGAPQRPMSILLVEDHDFTRRVMSRLIEDLGHKVHAADSVAAAKELVGRETFDAVISDLGLPDGTGHELMQWLRERYNLRGIALSGYGMEEDIERSRAAGFIDHITKPVDVQHLRAAIARLGGSA